METFREGLYISRYELRKHLGQMHGRGRPQGQGALLTGWCRRPREKLSLGRSHGGGLCEEKLRALGQPRGLMLLSCEPDGWNGLPEGRLGSAGHVTRCTRREGIGEVVGAEGARRV